MSTEKPPPLAAFSAVFRFATSSDVLSNLDSLESVSVNFTQTTSSMMTQSSPSAHSSTGALLGPLSSDNGSVPVAVSAGRVASAVPDLGRFAVQEPFLVCIVRTLRVSGD